MRPEVRNVGHDLDADDAPALALASAVLFATRTRDGAPSLARIEALRARMPHVGIYVVALFTNEVSDWLPRYAWAGVDEVFCLEVPSDDQALADTMRLRVQAPPPELALRSLWALWELLDVRSEAMHCVRNGFRQFDPERRLKWFGVCEKTLRTRLKSAGLPPQNLMARLGRALHAVELVRRGTRSMEEVARCVGFPTAADLAAARRRVERTLRKWPLLVALLPR